MFGGLQVSEALESAVYATAWVAAIIAAAVFVNRFGQRLIDRYLKLRETGGEGAKPEHLASRKRAYTAAALLRHTLRYAIVIFAAYAVAVAIASYFPRFATLLAGLGIAGVVVAFGAQAILRDVLAGFFIVFENQYAVGDVVRIRLSGFEVVGVVEEFSLRFTKVRDASGKLRFVPNGGILGVDRYASGYSTHRIDIFLPALANQETVRSSIAGVSELYKGHPVLAEPIQMGRLTSGDSGTLISVTVKAIPSEEQLADKIAKAVSLELTRALGLVEEPPMAVYEISEDGFSAYERSVLVG